METQNLSFSPTNSMFEKDKLPNITLKEGQADYGKPVEVKLLDLTAGKKVAIFAVPGAFTPGCSKSHLPSFVTAMDDLKTDLAEN